MSEQDKHKGIRPEDLFGDTSCISPQLLAKYAKNELSEEERNHVEKHLLDCEFCNEALEGIALMEDPTMLVNVASELNEKIGALSGSHRNKIIPMGTRTLIAAAAAVIIIVGTFTIVNKVMDTQEDQLALTEEVATDEKASVTDEFNYNQPEGGAAISDSSVSYMSIPESEIESLDDLSKKEKANIKKLAKEKKEQEERDFKIVLKEEDARNEKYADEELSVNDEISEADFADRNSTTLYEDAASEYTKEDKDSRLDQSSTAGTESATTMEMQEKVETVSSGKGAKKSKKAATTKSSSNNASSDNYYAAVNRKPQYPGGEAAMYDYIYKNIKYPEVEKESNIQGTVIISFIVDKKGKVSQAIIIKTVSDDIDAEALRVIKKMPKWEPGQDTDGKKVPIRVNVPVKFQLK